MTKRVASNVAAVAVCYGICSWPAALLAQSLADGIELTSGNDEIELKIDGEIETFLAADIVTFDAKGPAALELRFHIASKKRRAKDAIEGKVTLVRDGEQIADWPFETEPVHKGAKMVAVKGRVVSPAVVRHIQVPGGTHSFRITFDAPNKSIVAVQLNAMAELDRAVLLGPFEEPEPETPPPPPEPDPAPAAPPPTPSPPPTEPSPPPTPAAPQPVETISASVTRESSSDPEPTVRAGNPAPAPLSRKPEKPALVIKPIEVTQGDGTVAGATEALANALATAYEALGRETPFHRVAVPYFQELGDSVKDDHLGKLVPELLAAELAKRESFIVVERERLDQVMREHRLSGLGIVDDSTAAELGKVLGAQSLISGTVGEAGPAYVVTVKMVEVESGQVLVSGRVEIERAGLIALSSDAVIKRSVIGAAIRSALVPGWGQVYNGDSAKGYLMMSAWGLILGTAGAFTGLRVYWGVQYDGTQGVSPGEVASLRRDGNVFGQTANIAWAVYGVLWAAAIIDAVVNGQDFATVEIHGGESTAATSTSLGFGF